MRAQREDSPRLPGAKYKAVFAAGRILRGRLFTAYARIADDAGRQAGVVVSKKTFHLAVDRNRAKRIVRAAFASVRDRLPPSADWIFAGRRALSGCKSGDVAGEIVRLAARLEQAEEPGER